MNTGTLIAKEFFITINVTAGGLEPFKFKIPAEFKLINGFAITHDHYNGAYGEDDSILQIGVLRASFNNESSLPIVQAVHDNPADLPSGKIEFQPLNEETQEGEYVEGYYEDFNAVGDFTVILYLQGLLKFE